MIYTKIKILFFRKSIKRTLRLHYLPHIQMPFKLIGGSYVSVGNCFCSNECVVLEAISKHGTEQFKPLLKIGNNCFLNRGTHISCCTRIIIGDNFTCGSYVSIIDNNHGSISLEEAGIHPLERKLVGKEINIGNNVWVGEKATILGGVSIGDGVIIGSNAVVTSDVPPYSVAVGVPAKVIRKLT